MIKLTKSSKIRRAVFLLFLLANTVPTKASNDHTEKRARQETCQTLTCVRAQIDLIDDELIKLIGKRLIYVKRAGEIKGKNTPIHDQARENKILLNASKKAEVEGYPGSIAVEIFKTILAQSNFYEARP